MQQEIEERIHEPDLVSPTLRLLAEQPDGFLTTTDLIHALEIVFNPTGRDAEIIPDRADTYFSQKVRNLVSHREQPNSPIANGFIEYDADNSGLRITDAGRELYNSLGG